MTKYKVLRNVVLVLCIMGLMLGLARYTGIERTKLSPVERIIKSMVAPLESGATGVIQKAKDFFGMFAEIKELRKENALLKKKVSELNQEINHLKDYGLENIRLRNLLEYKQVHANNFKFLSAQVIARDHSNWYSTITINRGTNDGVRKDMAVVTHQGLVGRIINVTSRASEVLLILDQEGAVGGRVWETRETPGVVEGKGDTDDFLSMIHLPHDAQIEVGHTIVTSGLGGLFPPGIRIGKVIEIKEEASGLMKQATIEPFVNFSRLEEVLVILEVSDTYNIQEELREQREGASEQ
ncbi:MAG: rod shape-determining protein MreC [Clostridia bacterium]|nr:rod shape-determining protein MreC [Clostridia bacterium]